MLRAEPARCGARLEVVHLGQRRQGRRGAAGALAVALVCVVHALTPAAYAQVQLAPARDGHLGAWLVAGPMGEASVRQLELAALEPKALARVARAKWAPRWQLRSHADGGLDLRKQLQVGTAPGPYALLGGRLRLKSPLTGWLLLSVDGGATVVVDGQTLFSRDLPSLRDRAWDAVALNLQPGDHSLVLKLHHRGRHWALAVRVLDAKDLLPPAGLSLVLPGTTTQDIERLARTMQTVAVHPGLSRTGYRPRCVIEYRRGVPRSANLRAQIELRLGRRQQPLMRAKLGALVIASHGVQPLHALLPPIELQQSSARLELQVRVGAQAVTRQLTLSEDAPRLVDRATAQVAALRKDTARRLHDPAVTAATLQWHIARLDPAADGPAPDAKVLADALADLQRLLGALEQGRDPLLESKILDLGLPSELDGRPQHLRVHVPASFRANTAQRYPLVVLLHGYNGSPQGIMEAFLDRTARTAHPAVDGFLVAPDAHGNSFYRGPGEHAVIAALDWMLKRYPIDPTRVSITGVSMGGTGAAQLGLRHANRFAAAAPLCGYQSYFVRRDTSHRPLRPWERDRMHHWSPASFAASGRNLPMYVAHGTQDRPLQNSRVLVDAYHRLGYSMVDDWPDTGHSVWKKTYAGARMWPWLTRHRRDPKPRRVTLRTDCLRYGSLDWVQITALKDPGKMGEVDAQIAGPNKIVLATQGVTGLRLRRSWRHVVAQSPVVVYADSARLHFAPTEPILLRSDTAGWKKAFGQVAGRHKRAGLEGPIRDAWLGPLVFTFGSLDPRATRANREVAEVLAKMRYPIDVRFKVISDRQVTSDLERDNSLVLVGNPRNHQVLARLNARLPIRVGARHVQLEQERFRGAEVGTIFVYPNPDHPNRYVVAVESPTVPGILRALSLPQLLPDFVVYDARLAGAAGEQVLGSSSVLAGGFFRNDWSLPSHTRDPLAAAASH